MTQPNRRNLRSRVSTPKVREEQRKMAYTMQSAHGSDDLPSPIPIPRRADFPHRAATEQQQQNRDKLTQRRRKETIKQAREGASFEALMTTLTGIEHRRRGR